MSNLINRNDALKIIQSMYPGIPRVPWLRKDWQERYEPYIRAEKAIRDLPSAQPEIVRCKDCIYWVAHDKRCVYLDHGFAPNMWCCHAERRTDG